MNTPLHTTDFERLFREYYSRLYYYAFDLIQDEEASKDIVSDVFTEIWNGREQIQQGTITAYLYASVRNRCLNHLRKRCHEEEYIRFCQEATQDEDDAYYQAMEERISELTAEISKLPARTRYILEECYYHNRKYKEVAEVLEITPDGIKKHIIKAFAKLREHFNVKK